MASAENTVGSVQYTQSIDEGSVNEGTLKEGSVKKESTPKEGSVRKESVAGNRPSVNLQNLNISGNILNFLHTVREPLADYQERSGTPREESYAFIPLVTSLAQHAYNVTISIFVMLTSFLPMFDGLLYCVRFVLDKLIDIFESQDVKDKVMKTLIFLGELAIILIMTFLIMSLIIMPILSLTWLWFGKLWGMVWTSN